MSESIESQSTVPVMLAPMAGITDLPFRKLVQRFGASLVVSEMIASQDMINARPGTRQKAELGFDQGRTAVQLAGREPYWMGEAARMARDNGAQIIDINMGCPAKKVTGGQSGSALMRNLDLAVSLIRAVVRAVDVPVTLKTRLGWSDQQLNAPELARLAEAEGVSRLVIHGRTRCQFYKGQADWSAIGHVVRAVNIPVIANGDICDGADAKAAVGASGAAGVMVGRGAQGRPWRLAEIAGDLAGAPRQVTPTPSELAAMVSEHYEDVLSFYGEAIGTRVARKHLGWFADTAGTPAAERRALLVETDPKKVLSLIPAAMNRPMPLQEKAA